MDSMTPYAACTRSQTEYIEMPDLKLTRAQVRMYMPHYGDRTVRERSMYQPIQRCLKPHVHGPNPPASRT